MPSIEYLVHQALQDGQDVKSKAWLIAANKQVAPKMARQSIFDCVHQPR